MTYIQNVIFADGSKVIWWLTQILISSLLWNFPSYSVTGLCERTYCEVHFILVLRIKSYSKIMKFSTLDWNIHWVKSERAQLDIVDSKIFSRSQVLPAQILVSPGSTFLLTHPGPNLGCGTIRWLGTPDPLVDWDTNCSEDHNHGQVGDVAQ